MNSNRKPHLLRVRQQHVALLDQKIEGLIKGLSIAPTLQLQREIAIWIKQRNKVAKEADIKAIELKTKDGQGNLIYEVI